MEVMGFQNSNIHAKHCAQHTGTHVAMSLTTICGPLAVETLRFA